MKKVQARKAQTKKAQNLVEIGLLASVIVVIAISVFTIYNNQKLNVAKLSKTNVNTVNLNKLKNNPLANQPVSVNTESVETAGALSTLSMSASEFTTALSKLTYNDLLQKDSNGKDIVDYANQLLTDLNQTTIDKSSVNSNTVKTLVELLSNEKAKSNTVYTNFVERFTTILSKS